MDCFLCKCMSFLPKTYVRCATRFFQCPKFSDGFDCCDDDDFEYSRHYKCQNLKAYLIYIVWTVAMWQYYLAFRQYVLVKRTACPPEELKFVSLEKYVYTRRYILAKLKLSMSNCIYSAILSTAEIYYGLYYIYWQIATCIADTEVGQNCLWLIMLLLVYVICDTPFSLYDTLLIENKYGLTEKTFAKYVLDEIKLCALVLTMCIPITFILVNILNLRVSFFLLLWILTVILIFTAMSLYPYYLARLFTPFIPLPDGELKTCIINLCRQFRLHLKEVYLVNENAQSGHSNVKIIGFGARKELVLNKTLFPRATRKCNLTNDEILAVIAHELGHWRFCHYSQLFPVLVLYYFLIYIFYHCYFYHPCFYLAVGFPKCCQPKMAGLVGVALFLLTPFNIFLSFIRNLHTRKLEFEADAFVVSMRRGEDYIMGLTKSNENIMYCIFDSWYSCWNIDHPTLYERLLYINKMQTLEDMKIRICSGPVRCDNYSC